MGGYEILCSSSELYLIQLHPLGGTVFDYLQQRDGKLLSEEVPHDLILFILQSTCTFSKINFSTSIITTPGDFEVLCSNSAFFTACALKADLA